MSEPVDRGAWAFAAAGVVAIAVGVGGLGVIVYWYAIDMGADGSGAILVVSRRPIGVGAMVSVAAMLVGLGVLVLRRSVSVRSLGGAMLLTNTVVIAATVVAAVAAYPQVEPAALAFYANGWQTTLPVDRVDGLLSETADTVTIVGVANHRGCGFDLRSVTLDLSTGKILDVSSLPTFYADASQIPPAPADLPVDLEVLQGSVPFICRS